MVGKDKHPAVERWLVRLQRTGKSAHTCQSYARALAHLSDWWHITYRQPFAPELVETESLLLWKRYQLEVEEAKPATVNLRVVAVSRFLRWAADEGVIPGDPSSSVATVPLPEKEPRGLDEAAVDRLRRQALKEGDLRNIALLEVLLGTGMRVSEVLMLRRSDIILGESGGEALIRDDRGFEDRRVPLTSRVRKALQSYLDEGKGRGAQESVWEGQRGVLRDRTSVFRILKQWAWKTGLDEPTVNPQTLRHTFAARYLFANPGDLRGLAQILGNTSLVSVSVYAPEPDNLAVRMERVETAGGDAVLCQPNHNMDGVQ